MNSIRKTSIGRRRRRPKYRTRNWLRRMKVYETAVFHHASLPLTKRGALHPLKFPIMLIITFLGRSKHQKRMRNKLHTKRHMITLRRKVNLQLSFALKEEIVKDRTHPFRTTKSLETSPLEKCNILFDQRIEKLRIPQGPKCKQLFTKTFLNWTQKRPISKERPQATWAPNL